MLIINHILREYEKVNCVDDFRAINAYVQSRVEERLQTNFLNSTFIDKEKGEEG